MRQFGHAVSEPRRVVAVPTAPAICAKHAAWKRWPHAASATTPPSRESRQIEHCSMLAAAARTPKVVQTLAEALIYKRTAKGEKRSRPIAWENLFCWLGSASGVSASSPRSAGNRPSSHEERKPKLGLPYRQHVGRRRVARS